jgi:hypothetical protein
LDDICVQERGSLTHAGPAETQAAEAQGISTLESEEEGERDRGGGGGHAVGGGFGRGALAESLVFGLPATSGLGKCE